MNHGRDFALKQSDCPARKLCGAGACMLEYSSFSPEHVKAITVAFEDCLRALGLTDRPSDPAVLVIARRIIELAKQGECNPALLRDGALKAVMI
jgi:hypothetical protein